MHFGEQIRERGINTVPSRRAGSARKWAKRVTARARRRAEKRDPENAPRRRAVYCGWLS